MINIHSRRSLQVRTAKTAPRRKRRHPSTGGYARGGETRTRIITAALDVFGTNGFGGTSTRMIAKRAGVTLPVLQYYFDSKEGLYLACAEHIAGRLETRLGPGMANIRAALEKRKTSRRQSLQLLEQFFDQAADFYLGEHELEKWVLFIVREQAQPTKAFDILYDRMMQRTLLSCAEIVARLLRKPPNHPEVRIRTFALVGQIVFFRVAREAALRLLGWPDFDGDRLQLVKTALRAQLHAALANSKS
jgi:AcrR family transcriptional regulator